MSLEKQKSLEMRLDNIVFRLGMAPTIPGARQLVNHRHILVNGHIVDMPSFCSKPRDIITTKDNQRSKLLVQNSIASSNPSKLPKHLTVDTLQYKGLAQKILDRKCVDDENINSQPFMHWRDCFVFCAEAIYKAQAETGKIKEHYLNATAGTCEEMMKRAVFARELGVQFVMHDYLTGGFTANTTLFNYCHDNGLLLHIHRAMHAVIDRQKNHGMHFCVLAKALRMSGEDHIHAGTVVGKLEGEREMTLGFVDLLRDDYI
jgi:hypothetical protein